MRTTAPQITSLSTWDFRSTRLSPSMQPDSQPTHRCISPALRWLLRLNADERGMRYGWTEKEGWGDIG